MVDVFANTHLQEPVESLYLPIALWPVWWQMDRKFCALFLNDFLEEFILELRSIIHQDFDTSSKVAVNVV